MPANERASERAAVKIYHAALSDQANGVTAATLATEPTPMARKLNRPWLHPALPLFILGDLFRLDRIKETRIRKKSQKIGCVRLE